MDYRAIEKNIALPWSRFVLLMRAQGVTYLLHEVNTYDTDMTMQLYAENKQGQLIGVYNPVTQKGRIFKQSLKRWSRKGRKFTKFVIYK